MGKNLTRDPIPQWYYLSTVNGSELRIHIHEEAFCAIQKFDLSPTNWLVATHKSDYGLSEFVPPAKGIAWGFSSIFKPVDNQTAGDPWLTLSVELPNLKGSAHKEIISIRTSLYILFSMLFLFEGNTKENRKQLMTIDNMVLPDPNDQFGLEQGSVSATLTPVGGKWANKNPGNIADVIEVMTLANNHMCPEHPREASDFRAECEDGKILLQIPGNASYLASDNKSYKGEGHVLSSHNVDDGIQQIILLMALARLCQLMMENEN